MGPISNGRGKLHFPRMIQWELEPHPLDSLDLEDQEFASEDQMIESMDQVELIKQMDESMFRSNFEEFRFIESSTWI